MAQQQEIKIKEFKGTLASISNSPFLAAADISGMGDIEVTIEKVVTIDNVKSQNGRIENGVLALKFVGKDKMLWLNGENTKTLAFSFGQPESWPGNKISLYMKPDCKDPEVRGGTRPGIRIRKKPENQSDNAMNAMTNKLNK